MVRNCRSAITPFGLFDGDTTVDGLKQLLVQKLSLVGGSVLQESNSCNVRKGLHIFNLGLP